MDFPPHTLPFFFFSYRGEKISMVFVPSPPGVCWTNTCDLAWINA